MRSQSLVSRIDAYRARERRLVAGVMSGTSLDGIDVAFVEIAGTGSGLRQRPRAFHATPFPAEMKPRLLAASAGEIMLRETFELDADLGALYAATIVAAAGVVGLEIGEIDAVGLHGQTVYHRPGRRPAGLTVQIGSGAIVADRLGTIVVDDFRSADVAAGGEGAPLVPYCDYVLLRSDSVDRVALNIGGIANITWLPRDVSPETLVAFDTGPGNMLIDAAMRMLRDQDYDADGALAAAGSADSVWLEEMLRHPYFDRRPPKSAGREEFGEDVGRRLVGEGWARGLGDADIVATLTLLTVRSIARGVIVHGARGANVDEVIVGGGGARNATMMRLLADELPGTRIRPGDDLGVPADAKEALCFAILANEALCETPANVPSVTGAARQVVCGAVRVGSVEF